MRKQYRAIRKLAGFERDIPDPYNKNFHAHIEVFVPKPARDNPLPCILISIRNGHQKLFFRVASVAEISKALRVPRNASVRLKAALVEANYEADRIEQDYRLLFAKRHLLPGGQIVRTDTGEVIAQAERILKGATE